MNLTGRITRDLTGALLIILCCSAEVKAEERQLQLQWTQLAPEITGRNISTVLTDGTQVNGRVIAVQPDALIVQVKKLSTPARFSGTANIPRELVSFLRVSRPGWKWRSIGSLAGFFGGGGTGFAIGAAQDSLGGAFFGGMAGAGAGAAVGYILGDHADRHVTTISIAK